MTFPERAPDQNPYAAPQGVSTSAPGGSFGAPAHSPYELANHQVPLPGSTAISVGDSGMEHLRMSRGRYAAWIHVVFAFAIEICVLGFVPYILATFIAAAAGARGDSLITAGVIGGAIPGAIAAYFVFRDRWRCIEAFSSRYCIGVANISVLYVPLIAMVYANVRGVKKLTGG